MYDQGAAALIEGRRRVGENAFDQAMRAYIDTYAHQVVELADVEKAFKDVPVVVDLLRRREDCRGRADARDRPSSWVT